MRVSKLDVLVVAGAIVALAGPAYAAAVPGPVAGIGFGALAALGVGYRTLKHLIGR